MATSQVAPATTAAVVGSGTTTTTSETIAGLHIFSIDGFSATKDLGVGKSIKSSTFRVGGQDWYIECYPCGDDEESAGWVSLYLCRQGDHPGSRVSGYWEFTLMNSLKDGCFKKVTGHPGEWFAFADDDRNSPPSTDIIHREKLESLLKDDYFHVRCTVCVEKFPAVPQPDLGTGTVAGSHSHVLTLDGGAHDVGDVVHSKFHFAGHRWFISIFPCGDYDDEDEDEDEDKTSASTCIRLNLELLYTDCNDGVKVRFEITLLNHAGQTISSIQDFYTFSNRSNEYSCKFLSTMGHESSPLLRDGIQIRCDMVVVEGITATPNLRRGITGDLPGSQQVRGDLTFEVGGHLFAAHKCVLASRCTAFMAQFFGTSGKENADVTDPVRIDDMEPRVFEALLHFIYTDALPEVREEDKVGLAQGLLVAADRYAMERLKLISADMLCSYVNDARTAVDTLELAVKHGCHRLSEACKKFLMDNFAKVAP